MAQKLNYDRIYMKVGQSIQEKSYFSSEKKDPFSLGKGIVQEGIVQYIHPEGRFFEVYYKIGKSGYAETHPFTPAEIEEGRRLGIFRMPANAFLGEDEHSWHPERGGYAKYHDYDIDSIKDSPVTVDDIEAAMD